MLFCRQYFFQEVFVRFIFSQKSDQEKSILILQVVRAFTFCFSILFLLSNHMLFMMA